MIDRDIAAELQQSAAEYPVVTVLGPRQSGKTTLARMVFPDKPWVSLEDPDMRLVAEMDPRGFLGQWSAGAILDEVQRVPALLSYLQGLVDRDGGRGRFIPFSPASFSPAVRGGRDLGQVVRRGPPGPWSRTAPRCRARPRDAAGGCRRIRSNGLARPGHRRGLHRRPGRPG